MGRGGAGRGGEAGPGPPFSNYRDADLTCAWTVSPVSMRQLDLDCSRRCDVATLLKLMRAYSQLHVDFLSDGTGLSVQSGIINPAFELAVGLGLAAARSEGWGWWWVGRSSRAGPFPRGLGFTPVPSRPISSRRARQGDMTKMARLTNFSRASVT